MKVKNHRGHKMGQLSWSKRSEEIKSILFLGRENSERMRDTIMVKEGCEDEHEPQLRS